MAHPSTLQQLLAQESQRYHTFINLAIFLALFTGIEIVAIFVPWPFWLILSILGVLSVIKFVCVILWFMHLIYDKMLCLCLFVTGLLIGAGTLIALIALFDPENVDPAAFSQTPIVAEATSFLV